MQIQNEVNISLHTVVINVLFSWCTTKYKVIRVKNRSFTKLITSKQWCNNFTAQYWVVYILLVPT